MTITSSRLQLFTDEFVEGAGAIVFNPQKTQICILYNSRKNRYILPKGKRNVTESREITAVREVEEETGYKCQLLPLAMITRAPAADEKEASSDVPMKREESTDPFALTIRDEGRRKRKLIWWFIAQIDSSSATGSQSPFDGHFKSRWVPIEEIGRAHV